MKLIRSAAIAILLGWSSFSFADECPRGQICNMFENILNGKGGPFAGVTSGSVDQALLTTMLQKKMTCELKGNCTTADKYGCMSVSASVISGYVECWGTDEKRFQLIDYRTGELASDKKFDTAVNLANNNTGYPLVLAKKSVEGYQLLSGDGKVLADTEALGCEKFEAAGDDQVACIRNKPYRKFILKVSDLERANNASASLKDVADDMSVDLCAIALDKVNKKFRDSGMPKMMKNIFLGQKVDIELPGGKAITITTHDRDDYAGATCTMDLYDQKCRSIYLSKEGIACKKSDKIEYTKAMNVSTEDMNFVLKKYAFQNKQVVSMSEIFKQASDLSPYIYINRPDNLIGSTSFIKSASSSYSKSMSGSR